MNFVWPLIPALIGTALLALFFRRYRVVANMNSLEITAAERLRGAEEKAAAAREESRALRQDIQEMEKRMAATREQAVEMARTLAEGKMAATREKAVEIAQALAGGKIERRSTTTP